MRKSTDLSLIIIAAALSFVYGSTFGQLGFVLTGIPATNFLFTIGHSILACTFLLIYEGRRWRYFFQTSLVILFSVVIVFAYGRALNLISILPFFINSFLADILLNSLYGIFNKRNKLVFWSILGALYLVFTAMIVEIFTSYFFTPQEAWNTLLGLVLLMSPIIIIEGIVGGHIGHQLYCRVKGLLPNTSTK